MGHWLAFITVYRAMLKQADDDIQKEAVCLYSSSDLKVFTNQVSVNSQLLQNIVVQQWRYDQPPSNPPSLQLFFRSLPHSASTSRATPIEPSLPQLSPSPSITCTVNQSSRDPANVPMSTLLRLNSLPIISLQDSSHENSHPYTYPNLPSPSSIIVCCLNARGLSSNHQYL